MKAKLTPGRFLLIASLAVNAAFLVGYLGSAAFKKRMSSRKNRIKVIVRKLALTPEQQRLFQKLHTRANLAATHYGNTVKQKREEFWKELTRENPDREKLFRYLRETSENILAFNKTVTDVLLAFLSRLSPEQRDKFVEILRKRTLYSGKFLMSGR